MNVSALDNIVGPYNVGWSIPGWNTQQLVSASVVAATGGTYETKAPTREPQAEEETVTEDKADAKPVSKPKAKTSSKKKV